METEAISKILETGLLGAIIVILGFVVWFLYSRQNKQEDKHFEDMKEVWQNDVKYREEIKQLLANIVDLFKTKK
jgi:uncharacterized membrane-anchored protein YhcB (DUF1043 family)